MHLVSWKWDFHYLLCLPLIVLGGPLWFINHQPPTATITRAESKAVRTHTRSVFQIKFWSRRGKGLRLSGAGAHARQAETQAFGSRRQRGGATPSRDPPHSHRGGRRQQEAQEKVCSVRSSVCLSPPLPSRHAILVTRIHML